MSRRTLYCEKFKGLNRMPMPIFVTNVEGVVLYKNNLSSSNYTFRVGSNVFAYACSDDADTVRKLVAKDFTATIVLGCDAWGCVCIVIPKEVDGEKCCIFSSVPYSYDFLDGISDLRMRNRQEKENYFTELEKQISVVLSSAENDACDISEAESRKLKNNALKLMRLEKRLRDRLFCAKELPVYSAGLQMSRNTSKSVELCSFAERMTKNLNSLSAVVGFNLVYVPLKDYSICRCNSYDLARLFIYVSVFCLKFGEKCDVCVAVDKEAEDSVLVFKPKISLDTYTRFANFDIDYIRTCAGKLGYTIETVNGDEFIECIKLRIPAEAPGSALKMSAESYLFDIPVDFIGKIYDEADAFIGNMENE